MFSKNHGFSIIESVISTCLLSILIIMTAGILPQALKCSKKSSLLLSASSSALTLLSIAEEKDIPYDTFISGIYPQYSSIEETLKICNEYDLEQLSSSSEALAHTGKILLKTDKYKTWLWFIITYRLTNEDESEYPQCPITLVDISVEGWWNDDSPSEQVFKGCKHMKKIMYTKRIIVEKRKN